MRPSVISPPSTGARERRLRRRLEPRRARAPVSTSPRSAARIAPQPASSIVGKSARGGYVIIPSAIVAG